MCGNRQECYLFERSVTGRALCRLEGRCRLDAVTGAVDFSNMEQIQDLSDGSRYYYEHMRTRADAYMSTPKHPASKRASLSSNSLPSTSLVFSLVLLFPGFPVDRLIAGVRSLELLARLVFGVRLRGVSFVLGAFWLFSCVFLGLSLEPVEPPSRTSNPHSSPSPE